MHVCIYVDPLLIDNRFIASTGFDRTFKLWADENLVI